jgi:hypothetical protein
MERLVCLWALVPIVVLAAALPAPGQDCVVLKAPEMVDILEGDRQVEIWWRDVYPESLTCVLQPKLGTAQSPWLGNASLSAGGFYTGACDFVYKFTVNVTTTAGFRWTEVNWLTGASTRKTLTVTDTDTPYTLSDGITVTISSGGLFTVTDSERWTPGAPAFNGVYTGGTDTTSATPVVFTFACATGGDLAGSGGGVVVNWSNDAGRSGSITAEAADTDYAVEKGLRVKFPSGTYASGDTLVMEALRPLVNNDQFSIEGATFDGYEVLRRSVEDRHGIYKVIANISRCDTAAFFLPVDGTRYFVDMGIRDGGVGVTPDPTAPTVLNGFPYEYAVVTYDVLSDPAHPGEIVRSTPAPVKVYPSPPVGNSVSDVYVVPNPYLFHAGWEETSGPAAGAKLQFMNVPLRAEIRIFDTSGNYIETVYPSLKTDGETQSGRAEWDLKNASGEDVVSGVYIYYITAGGSEKVGRFIIVR